MELLSLKILWYPVVGNLVVQQLERLRNITIRLDTDGTACAGGQMKMESWRSYRGGGSIMFGFNLLNVKKIVEKI